MIATSTFGIAPDEAEDPTEAHCQYDALRPDNQHVVLRIITGDDAGAVIELKEGSYVIGRARGVDIRIDQRGVSRLHARVIRSGNNVMVEDLGSRNGTFYENARLLGRQKLIEGQRISIGGTVLRLSRLDHQDMITARSLADAARKDPLTGCFNRGYFDRRLHAEIERTHKNDRSTSLVLIDLDHFKQINDRHGHTAGDATLRAVAQILQGVTRAEDVVARYGGEEFAVIVPGATTLGAALLAQRARCAIEQAMIDADGTPLRVTASLGVATLDRGQTWCSQELIRASDEALYVAKHAGRNRVHIGQITRGEEGRRLFSDPPLTVTEYTKL